MYETLPFGITAIDTGFMGGVGRASCYLLESDGEVAIIETGVAATTERVLALLDRRQIPFDRVRYVIPTHIHLDHAGGASSLIATLPNAQLVVHPRGARHMIDPSKLIAGAKEVYGEEVFNKTYGQITPILENRVSVAEDNSVLMVGRRELLFRDTPGHANHHFCVWDATSRGWFSGDTLGVGYRELALGDVPFLMPSTTPVQFDPEKLLQSITMLMSYSPRWIYLTHYSAIPATTAVVHRLCQQISDYVSLAESLANESGKERVTAEQLEGVLTDYTYENLKACGCQLSVDKVREIAGLDLKLNSQGLLAWMEKSLPAE